MQQQQQQPPTSDGANDHSHFHTATSSSNQLPSLHLDYIHDIAYDHYGRRLATCSGDRFIRVWDLNSKGEWTSHRGMGEWQAHRGTVNRLSWAHPEYGQLLASCGSDHSVIIWEEREQSQHQDVTSQSSQQQQPGGAQQQHPPGQPPHTHVQQQAHVSQSAQTQTSVNQNQPQATAVSTHWVSKAQLTDARKSVTCVQFAPRHLGLKIATGSADGKVRVYEAIDVMNLIHWPMTGSIDVLSPAPSPSSANDATEDGAGGTATSADLPSSEREQSLLSSAMTDATSSQLGVTALAWCQGRFEPPTLVVGTGQGDVLIYRYSDTSRSWQTLLKMPSHSRGVLDVAWAPNVGRSFHLVASAGKDRALRVNKLNRHRFSASARSTGNSSAGTGTNQSTGTPATGGSKGSSKNTTSTESPTQQGGGGEISVSSLELASSQVLGDGMMEVWRCAWNVTGTVLASSGDGGIVQLWKSNFRNEWKCVGEVMGDAADGMSNQP
jgi:nucleoporin SEH1